jgi:hypothetical protein
MSLKSAVAVAGLLVVAGTGFAGPVPWSFSAPSNEAFFPAGATGGITFPNLALQAGGSSIVAARVAEWSIATAGSPDLASGLGYHFDLEVRDDLSGQTATMTFEGILNGSYWRTGSNLTTTFTGATTQTATLGGNLYTVALTGFDAPTGYGDELAGQITAGVRVGPPVKDGPGGGTGGGGGPVLDPTATPEPTTLLLAALGLPALGALRLARRKRAA